MLDPDEVLFLLNGNGIAGPLFFGGFLSGRFTIGGQHTQGQPVGRDGQSGVQVQATALHAGLVGADHPQPFTLIEVVVMQVAAVLHAQHDLLSHHPAHRTPAVRRQDVGQAYCRLFGLVNHPVIGLDHWPVALSHATESPIGHPCFGFRHVD